MKNRIYKEGYGWGRIFFETDSYILVKFDAHPLNVEQFAK